MTSSSIDYLNAVETEEQAWQEYRARKDAPSGARERWVAAMAATDAARRADSEINS